MPNPPILVRVQPKLLVALKQQSKQSSETVQQLIRRILTRNVLRKKQRELAYGFAGPAKRKIEDYLDSFSERRK